MFISLNSLVGVGDAEMEKKDSTFNYLNSKMIEIIFATYSKFQNYYELIILNVVTFDVSPLNAKCNNLIFQVKSVECSNSLIRT